MKIDLFSIVVVIIAFSLFFIPIAIDKMKSNKKNGSQDMD
jgi:hypothetical protein